MSAQAATPSGALKALWRLWAVPQKLREAVLLGEERAAGLDDVMRTFMFVIPKVKPLHQIDASMGGQTSFCTHLAEPDTWIIVDASASAVQQDTSLKSIAKPHRAPAALIARDGLPCLEAACTAHSIQTENRVFLASALLRNFRFSCPCAVSHCHAMQARTTTPTAWCVCPDRTAVAAAAAEALRLGQHFAHSSGPLATALVRGRLFFPDRRLIQFDCGKLQVRVGMRLETPGPVE